MAERTAIPTTARVVATNTLWGASGRLFGGFFAIVALAVISRTLGPEQYGEYATALAFFYIFSAIADLGIYQVLIRDLGKPNQNEPQIIGTAFTIRIIAVSAALAIGLLVFWAIPKYTDIHSFGILAAIVYLPLSLGQIFMAVFQKHLAVRYAALIELFSRGIQVVGVIWLASIAITTAKPFLLVLLSATIIQTVLLAIWARKLTPIRLGLGGAKNMLQSALPVGIALIFTLIYFRLDTVLLSLFQESEAVGIYNLAYKVLEQFIFLPAMFLGVLTPILSRAFSEDREKFRHITRNAAKALLIAITPILIGGWFLREQVILLLGGSEYQAAADPLAPLLLAVALIFAGTLLGALVVICDRQKKALWVYAGAMVVSVCLNILFIPKYSYMGTAWTTVATEVLVVGGLYWILRGSGASFRFPFWPHIIFAGGIMALPLFWANTLTGAVGVVASLLVYLFICPIIYFGALFMLKAIRVKEVRALLSRDGA